MAAGIMGVMLAKNLKMIRNEGMIKQLALCKKLHKGKRQKSSQVSFSCQ